VLRDDDLPLLRALIPVVLAGTRPPTLVLHSLDYKLAPVAGNAQAHPATVRRAQHGRDPRAADRHLGQLGQASRAGPAFLQRWQDSSLNLLRMGHASLLQLVQMAWYGARSLGRLRLPRPTQNLKTTRASPMPVPDPFRQGLERGWITHDASRLSTT
jgi:hypothetical protein